MRSFDPAGQLLAAISREAGRRLGQQAGRGVGATAGEVGANRLRAAEEERRARALRQPSPAGINGYGYRPGPGDGNLMARTLFAEFSTAKSWDDMAAGAWSIINRIRPQGEWPPYRTRDTLGRTLPEVLERRSGSGTAQYSFIPRGGLAGPGGSSQWQRSAHPERLTGADRKAWQRAMMTAKNVLGGFLPDPTGGATHFHHAVIDDQRVKPSTVTNFFGSAQDGTSTRPPTLTESRYRSPALQNFFYHSLEDLEKPAFPPR